jgi:predicted DNA-binding transcriptional regulator AlpA
MEHLTFGRVAALCGVTRARLEYWLRDDQFRFPRPMLTGRVHPVYSASEIQAWLKGAMVPIWRVVAIPRAPRAPRAEDKTLPCELYRWFSADGSLLYVGISLSSVARAFQHRSEAVWYREACSMTIERCASVKEALSREAEAIRAERPRYNIRGRDRDEHGSVSLDFQGNS